jgi:hypothetical protein
MIANVPIVVIGFNRPKAIERLLGSLLKADYPGPVELIISIDGEAEKRGGGEAGKQGSREAGKRGRGEAGKLGKGEAGKRGRGEEVRRIAADFEWPFGEKKLIFHESNLGLRKHVLSCGDLSKDYDGIIVLEDDLYVSPVFYQYTLQAFDFYKDDPKIAGISLYSHAYNETAQFPFRPLADDADIFFLQYAASLGQFWSSEGWAGFREWYDKLAGLPGDKSPGKSGQLPPNILMWPETSWKKYFISYILQKNLYFVYPRFSLTTNFGDEGSNLRISENLFQVQLWLEMQEFRFKSFDESLAVYDVYCEIIASRLKKLAPVLAEHDFETDLYGMKSRENTDREKFLTSRHCPRPILTIGREMKPHEMNILAGVPGKYFSLGLKNDFEEKNYFLRLLKCHEKKELAYWYTIREYHFFKNRLLTKNKFSQLYFNPVFLFRKTIIMLNYTLRYFRKGY